MKTFLRPALLVALIAAALGAGVAPASAAMPKPILYGTTGACNNVNPGGPCTQNSVLVELDPGSGAPIRTIGSVGYTVNGLAWDPKTAKLFASTAIGCGVVGSVCPFHGLIRIDTTTGAGTPVNPAATNFGLAGNPSPVHSITVNGAGRMVAWYDEVGATDTFVTIDKTTGVATEFPNTGIDTAANGLAFDVFNNLWNIDTARRNGAVVTQTAYVVDPRTGKPLRSELLAPPTMAALGDFNPFTNVYYGLSFNPFSTDPTFIELVDVTTGTVTQLGQTVPDLHTLTFVKKVK